MGSGLALGEWGDVVRDLVWTKGVVPARWVRAASMGPYAASQFCAALTVRRTKSAGIRVWGIIMWERSVSSGGDEEGSRLGEGLGVRQEEGLYQGSW
jgi:hypothetical protein